MATFNFREYLVSKSAKTPRTKVSVSDPSGMQEPLKTVLEGSCTPTDDGLVRLAAEQKKIFNGKQRQPETETGVQSTLVVPFSGEKFAEIIHERADLIDKHAGEIVEAVKEKTAKKNGEVNRVKEAVGSNGSK